MEGGVVGSRLILFILSRFACIVIGSRKQFFVFFPLPFWESSPHEYTKESRSSRSSNGVSPLVIGHLQPEFSSPGFDCKQFCLFSFNNCFHFFELIWKNTTVINIEKVTGAVRHLQVVLVLWASQFNVSVARMGCFCEDTRITLGQKS